MFIKGIFYNLHFSDSIWYNTLVNKKEKLLLEINNIIDDINEELNNDIDEELDDIDNEEESEKTAFVDVFTGGASSSISGDFTLPVIPLRNMVLAPNVIVVLFVGRKPSIKTIEEFKDQSLFFVLQRNQSVDKPKPKDLYDVGTVAKILEIEWLADKTLKILVQGQSRAKANSIEPSEDGKSLIAKVSTVPDLNDTTTEDEELIEKMKKSFLEYLKLKKQNSSELVSLMDEIKDVGELIDLIAIHIEFTPEHRQELLEELSVKQRLQQFVQLLDTEIEKTKLTDKISKNVKSQVVKSQKEFLLRAQMDAIRKELGDGGDNIDDEIENYKKLLKTLPMSEEAKDKAEKEIKKLKGMSPMSVEAGIVRNYLEWIFALPWGETKKLEIDLSKAEELLEKNHYGLPKVKERIYEMLAMQKRTGSVKGSILCFYGPPGVGKTSLAKSIAEATGREFIRVSLGGLHDEAEIRGHRSTYIGAKPGRIMQGVRSAKSDNPLILLDEIGEIGQDWRGNPAGALLELLDPEQQHFRDNFLEIEWDFSKTLFVVTTNNLDLPPALVDRLEIINFAGYTEEEKMRIAKEYLIEKQRKVHGLEKTEITITDEAVRAIIKRYTREAGVRNLEREIANVSRKVLRKVLKSKTEAQEQAGKDINVVKSGAKSVAVDEITHITVTPENLHEFLGAPKYRDSGAELANKVGVVTGLAWTQMGGEIMYIEAVSMPGSGKINITGKLGEVMKESAQAAVSFVRSRAEQYKLDPNMFEKTDIHIHMPEGAIPKDGPSAGVAICVAIVSALTGRAVRGDVAMTGELSLRSKVLPIGGLKEKLLAALRAGIKEAMIPMENKKDLDDLTDISLEGLEVIPMENMQDMIDRALVSEK